MINPEERVNWSSDGRVNRSFYQDFGEAPISEYKNHINEHLSYGSKLTDAVVDFSDDVVVGTKSLLIAPPTSSYRASTDPYYYCYTRLGLYSGDGVGCFWVSDSSMYINIRYKKLDANTTLDIGLWRESRNIDEDTSYWWMMSPNVENGSGNVNEWINKSFVITGLSWQVVNRYYVVLTVGKGRILLDGLSISSVNSTTFRKDNVARKLKEYLLEGGDRSFYLTINGVRVPDETNGYVLDSDSVVVTKSIGDNKTFGGCNSNELTCDVYDKGELNKGDEVSLSMVINGVDYSFFTGKISKIDRAFDQDWASLTCYDALNVDKNIDYFYRSYFDVPPDGYVGVWDSATTYAEGNIVLYNSKYYEYNFTVSPSLLYPVTFNGSTYSTISSLLRAMTGVTPDNCNYSYRGSEFSLTSYDYITPYASKTYQTRYKGVWSSTATYNNGDVVLYNSKYYRYLYGVEYYSNGVKYKTLLKGVAPNNIASQYQSVHSSLISEVRDYDPYSYPEIPLGDFGDALLGYLNIPRASGLNWNISIFENNSWLNVFPPDIIYDPGLKNINAMEALKSLCQICGAFGYINSDGYFDLLRPSYTISNSVVELGNNYVSGSTNFDLENNLSIDQIRVSGKEAMIGPSYEKIIKSSETVYKYPLIDGNNVVDISNNIFISKIIENLGIADDDVRYLFRSNKNVKWGGLKVEEIVGIFIEPGTVMEIQNVDGVKVQAMVSKGVYKGNALIDQEVESSNIV